MCCEQLSVLPLLLVNMMKLRLYGPYKDVLWSEVGPHHPRGNSGAVPELLGQFVGVYPLVQELVRFLFGQLALPQF